MSIFRASVAVLLLAMPAVADPLADEQLVKSEPADSCDIYRGLINEAEEDATATHLDAVAYSTKVADWWEVGERMGCEWAQVKPQISGPANRL